MTKKKWLTFQIKSKHNANNSPLLKHDASCTSYSVLVQSYLPHDSRRECHGLGQHPVLVAFGDIEPFQADVQQTGHVHGHVQSMQKVEAVWRRLVSLEVQ